LRPTSPITLTTRLASQRETVSAFVLYRFRGDLTEALRTNEPKNEIKHTGKPMDQQGSEGDVEHRVERVVVRERGSVELDRGVLRTIGTTAAVVKGG
jgi:hypothetical protein